jgi:hypothetical protein
MDDPHELLRAAEARRAAITETIHNLGAEGARLDKRLVELRHEVARLGTKHLPCWQCETEQAKTIRHILSNADRAVSWSPGGLPQSCCRVYSFERRGVPSVGVV